MRTDRGQQQKITAHIPHHLLRAAQDITGAGITETIRIGLENLTRKQTFEDILSLHGGYQSELDVSTLREDR